MRMYYLIRKTINQLVEFCRKVNIPYEVYFFTSERDYEKREDGDFSSNVSDI